MERRKEASGFEIVFAGPLTVNLFGGIARLRDKKWGGEEGLEFLEVTGVPGDYKLNLVTIEQLESFEDRKNLFEPAILRKNILRKVSEPTASAALKSGLRYINGQSWSKRSNISSGRMYEDSFVLKGEQDKIIIFSGKNKKIDIFSMPASISPRRRQSFPR